MAVNLGINIQRSPNRINQQLREAGVGGKYPKLLLDFADNYYLASGGSKTLANAVTHARAGNATMTDGYGPELVTNGGFDSDSDWTLGTGFSIEGGKLQLTGVADLAVSTIPITLEANKVYEVQLTVSDFASGSFRVLGYSATNSGSSDDINSGGVYRFLLPIDGSGTAYLGKFVVQSRSAGTSVTIDNVSVREMPVIKWAPHNLMTYSEQFDNDTSTSNQGVTVTGNAGVAPDGTSTADRVVGTGGWFRQRNFTHTIGTTLTTNMWVKSNTGSNQTFRLYGDNNQVSANVTATSEWQLFSYEYTVATGGSTGDGITRDTSNTAVDLLVWGHHAYRSDLGGMADNPDRGDSYVPTASAAKYLPRVGHHVYNGSAWVNEGVLAESEARTNLLTYSTPDSNWNNSDSTDTANQAVAPDGTQTATLVVDTTANANHYIESLAVTIASGAVTGSMYVKKESISFARLRLDGTSGNRRAWFDLDNGAVGSVDSSAIGTIQDVGNGWFRLSLTEPDNTNSGTAKLQLFLNTADSETSYVGDGSGAYLWGAQLEQAYTPSSLIPTSGSSVSRAAETFTIPSANLPWPTPQYIGSERLTGSWAVPSAYDNTVSGTGTGVSVTGGTSQSRAYLSIDGVDTGEIYQVDLTVNSVSSGTVTLFLRDGSNPNSGTLLATSSALGAGATYTAHVAAASNDMLVLLAGGTGADFDATVSVREINPMSVSIAMEGRVTYADIDSYSTVIPYNWRIDNGNKLDAIVSTNSSDTGGVYFRQSESSVFDEVFENDVYNVGVNVPFNIAARHGSTFINGGIDGVARTVNTTPTALVDLSATDLNLAYLYMGTVSEFRVWEKDITDAGLVEATEPSLEPSLSLTFEGVGTNSFVVNDWSQ